MAILRGPGPFDGGSTPPGTTFDNESLNNSNYIESYFKWGSN